MKAALVLFRLLAVTPDGAVYDLDRGITLEDCGNSIAALVQYYDGAGNLIPLPDDASRVCEPMPMQGPPSPSPGLDSTARPD